MQETCRIHHIRGEQAGNGQKSLERLQTQPKWAIPVKMHRPLVGDFRVDPQEFWEFLRGLLAIVAILAKLTPASFEFVPRH